MMMHAPYARSERRQCDEGEFKAKDRIGGGAVTSPEDWLDRQALRAVHGPPGNRHMSRVDAVRRRDGMTAAEKHDLVRNDSKWKVAVDFYLRSTNRKCDPALKAAGFGNPGGKHRVKLRQLAAERERQWDEPRWREPRWKDAVDFYMSQAGTRPVQGRGTYKAALAAATPPFAITGPNTTKLKWLVAKMIDEQMIEEEEDEVPTQHEPVLLRDFFPPTPPTAYSRLAAAASADEPEEIAYIDLVSDSDSEDEAEDDETEDDETGDALSPTLQKRLERYTERLMVLPGTRTEDLSLAAVRACIASSTFKRRRVFPVSHDALCCAFPCCSLCILS